MKELGEIVETGPDPAVDGVVRPGGGSTAKRVIEARFARRIYSVGAGYPDCLPNWALRHIKCPPAASQEVSGSCEAFKMKYFGDTSRCISADLPAGTPVEIWAGSRSHVLARSIGVAPVGEVQHRAPASRTDQRYRNAYLFGAILACSRQVGRRHAALGGRASFGTMHLDEIMPRPRKAMPCADRGSGRMARQSSANSKSRRTSPSSCCHRCAPRS